MLTTAGRAHFGGPHARGRPSLAGPGGATTHDGDHVGRDVRRAVTARFITNTGAEAGFFIGMWGKAAYTLEGGPVALAIMTFLIAVTSVLGNVVGGLLVDRFDARRVLISAEVLLVPAVLLLILADSLPALLLTATIPFLLHGVEETAATSLPPALIDEGDDDLLVRVNARLEGAGWLAMVVGPAAGGVLAGVVSLDSVFVFDAATSLVSVFLLLGVHLAPRPVADDDAEALRGLDATLAGLRLARRTPRILLAMVIGATLWFAFGAFVALEPLYYRDVLGKGPEVIGYVNAVFGLGMFAGSTVVDRVGRRFGYRTALLLAAWGGLGAVVYVGTSSLAVVVLGAVLWSIPLGMIFPILRTLAQKAAPPGMLGRVMGAIATAQNTTSVLPALFVPFLATSVGVQPTLVAGGFLPALGLPLLWAWAGRLDAELAAEDPTEVAPTPHPGQATPLP